MTCFLQKNNTDDDDDYGHDDNHKNDNDNNNHNRLFTIFVSCVTQSSHWYLHSPGAEPHIRLH